MSRTRMNGFLWLVVGLCLVALAQGQEVVRDSGAQIEEATFTSWDLPRPGTRPGAIDFASNGDPWFSVAGRLAHLELATGKITEYTPPGPDVVSVCRVGPEDFVWCSSLFGGRGERPQGTMELNLGEDKMQIQKRGSLTGHAIIRFNPRDQSWRTYYVGRANSGPDRTDFDSKGNIWFTEIIGNQLGRLNIETGVITEFPVPSWTIPEAPGNKQTGTTYPYGLEVDKFDNVWIALNRGYKIVKFDQETETFTEYVPPTGLNGTRNVDSDADGNVWFTMSYKRKVGKIDAKTGLITEYEVPGLNAYPYHIRVAGDGNVWFWDQVYSYMTAFDPETERFATYKPPWSELQVVSRHLRIDKKGRVWFPDENNSKIGMIELIPAAAAGGR